MSFYVCKNQHGFRPYMFVSTNLLLYQSKILTFFNDHAQIGLIYADFQKDFNKASHSLLLSKLVSFGIHGNFLDCLESCINFRT